MKNLLSYIFTSKKKIDNITYENSIKDTDVVYTIDKWRELLKVSEIRGSGRGYWAKDGKFSYRDVFRTEQLDATNVVWCNINNY